MRWRDVVVGGFLVLYLLALGYTGLLVGDWLADVLRRVVGGCG